MTKNESSERNIGEIIRSIAEQKGLKFKSIAQSAEMSLSHLNKIMSGEKNPSLEKIRDLARALGVTEADLVGDKRAASIEKRIGDMTASEFLSSIWDIPKMADPTTRKLIELVMRLPSNRRANLIQVVEALLVQAEDRQGPRSSTSKRKA